MKFVINILLNGAFTLIFVGLGYTAIGQKKLWEKKYPMFGTPGSYGSIINAVESYDNGFCIGGTVLFNSGSVIRLYKIDENGNVLWQRIIGDSSQWPQLSGMVCTKDGGLLLTGAVDLTLGAKDYLMNNFLLKLNACGEAEWSKIYALNQYSIGGPLTTLKNGDLIVSSYVAITKDTVNNYYDNWIFRADNMGNIKWQVFDNLNSSFVMLDQSENIITTGFCWLPYPGQSNFGGIIKCGVVNLDTSGKRNWYAEYSVEKHIDCAGTASVQTKDKGYLTFADDYDVQAKDALLLIKFDFKGRSLWSKLIADTSQQEFPITINSLNDSTFLAVAATNIDPNNDAVYDLKLLKINSAGQILKQIIFPNPERRTWQFNNINFRMMLSLW